MFLRLHRAGDVDPHLDQYVWVRIGSYKRMVRVTPSEEGKKPYTFMGYGVVNQNGQELGESVLETPETITGLEQLVKEGEKVGASLKHFTLGCGAGPEGTSGQGWIGTV